uniref:NADH dehydrogenase subunit 2 n=1 Tax=Antonbruunia milenae TaxID=3053535 RepID=UPI0030E081E4
MMSFMPFHTMFMTSMMLGTIIAVSANNWLFIWMGLEVNLMSFVSLVFISKQNQETEAAIKYFMIQAMASGMMLLGSAGVMFSFYYFVGFKFSGLILLGALLIKLGAAPLHWWLPSVMSGMSWFMCLCLSTWQKVAPFSLILMLSESSSMPRVMTAVGLGSVIVGGIGGMNQSQLRLVMAYSSIGHLGWMISAMKYSISVSMLYFMMYMLISITVFTGLQKSWAQSHSSFSSMLNQGKWEANINLLSLLSLSGLPPLIGFMPKWAVLQLLMMNDSIGLAYVLAVGSMLSLYYYLNMLFVMNLVSSSVVKNKDSNYSYWGIMLMINCLLPVMMFVK